MLGKEVVGLNFAVRAVYDGRHRVLVRKPKSAAVPVNRRLGKAHALRELRFGEAFNFKVFEKCHAGIIPLWHYFATPKWI